MRRGRPVPPPASFFQTWAAENAAAVSAPADPVAPAVPAEPVACAADGSGSPRLRRAGTVLLVAGTAGALMLPGPNASADPSANDWYRLRMCESGNNYAINTGNAHYGAYQFDLSTWRSVGGSGYPHVASPAEQDARALILYRQRGWQPWECASILGLRPDGSAGSGRVSDIRVTGGGTRTGAPPFPGGSHWYAYGETNPSIKVFQDQMHARGYFPVGTGQYGPNTLRMVKQLQALNGLQPNGFIGPNTWRLAWTGTYTDPGRSPAAPASPALKPAPKPRPAPTPSAAPPFPGGSHWYAYGETNPSIKVFQDQMHARGYFPVGTGQYGPNTLRMVKQLQALNGLQPNGFIGPNTWRLAWTGTYRNP